MSLFAEYIEELARKSIIESDRGFATYYELPGGMYIEDIYVRQEFRNEAVAAEMANQIAQIAVAKGIKKLIGSVKPSNKNSTTSMKVLLAYGFKLESACNDGIILVKEI